MTEKGLEPVTNPASLFLTKRKENQQHEFKGKTGSTVWWS